MPTAHIGDKTNIDRKEFLELKGRGEKVRIRLANAAYYYEAKHFMKNNDEWLVTLCPRINNDLDCNYCNQFFAIKNEIKEEKMQPTQDKEKIKGLEKAADKVKPSTAFYYPVLDRESKSAATLKTTLTTRLKFEEDQNNGVNILNFDYVITRTEKPGSYYSIDRVDSSETPKLDKQEKEELKKARELDLEKVVSGKKGLMNHQPDSIDKMLDEAGLAQK